VGSTANYVIPYPEPTDPVRDGAANMRAIAERVAVLLQNALPGGIGFRFGSSVVTLGAGGDAVIPISPGFVRDIFPGGGSLTVAINGDASGSTLIIGSHSAQQWGHQWTVLCKNPGGTVAAPGPYRINWIAMGYVT
jgi:hypothetical protein